MKSISKHLPAAIIAAVSAAALWYGPINQPANYHDFADQSVRLGISHFADVLSNLGFALVALWGWSQIAPSSTDPRVKNGWAGYRLFMIGLLLTAFGSAYYHLEPTNASLFWDRLPIALACAGLLSGVWGEVHGRRSSPLMSVLSIAAVLSVAWWYFTELAGAGDLRPYLLLQVAPLLLIPLWQGIHDSPRADRLAFGIALLLYLAAKLTELYDHEIAAALGSISGHTLKHLLATGAAALIIGRLAVRVRSAAVVVANRACQQEESGENHV